MTASGFWMMNLHLLDSFYRATISLVAKAKR